MSNTARTSSASRRSARFDDSNLSIVSNTRTLPEVEKDVDDPTTPVESRAAAEREYTSTPTALTRLFAAEMIISPSTSRQPSYNSYTGAITRSTDSTTLPEHLYTRGFLGGRHSDITILAFGNSYDLHRLILDRSPFFRNGLSEPWVEASAKEVPLHPEELDTNITKISFELALKKLYGVDISQEEDQEAIGLFATGCWLEMQDLVNSAIESILRQMAPENLAGLIRLVTNNYYGKSGERILASARAMICRDGWEMPLKYWDNIPAEVINDIVGGDGFFVPGEWDRWVLSKRLLDRRLKYRAIDAGIMGQFDRARPKAPNSTGFMTLRFEPKCRKDFLNSNANAFSLAEQDMSWASLYTHQEIEPILTLLEQGVHYLHLEFEQLMFIRQARDIFGVPVLSERVVTDAQWMQLELRHKVLSARETDMELGLKQERKTDDAGNLMPAIPSRKSSYKGKEKATEVNNSWVNAMSSANTPSEPSKFPIPSQDCNIVIGGNADPVITTSSSSTRHASQLSSDTTDLQFATEFAGSPPNNRPTTPGSGSDKGTSVSNTQPRPTAYSNFPPFRFSAEFPNPRSLKEKKRVYSRTVFYAGSLWNVYIQKVRSAKNPQLGVYLHRAKEREVEEGVISGIGAGANAGTVDEQIGLLEREMLLRSERRERRHARATRSSAAGHRSVQSQPVDLGATRHNGGEESSGSGVEADTGAQASSTARLASYGRRRDRPTRSSLGAEQNWTFPQLTSLSSPSGSDTDNSDDDDDDDLFNAFSTIPPPGPGITRTPTLPPYVDGRPTIRTYFKIYSPSKGGRLLSVYESAPDRFNFSQSWGWKSGSLMLDEGFDTSGTSAGVGGLENNVDMGAESDAKGEGKLRFMIVIGNL
ncbi:hypothetical protein NA57DRAFT_40332 [Rhizodiscina lignyota]|uniref:BTB domain-containing protein n=1 Tax=Rhizodiscina lignyota TaxID=1504668 RepID=A0A9P4IA36_9PEZI|nr:hypothetical protein NA57DRAFT_40332 [Rhizodiscina lignyota]